MTNFNRCVPPRPNDRFPRYIKGSGMIYRDGDVVTVFYVLLAIR